MFFLPFQGMNLWRNVFIGVECLEGLMGKSISISTESLQRFLGQLQESLSEAWEKVKAYFMNLTLYQLIAWGAIGLGLILVIVALIIW